MRKKVRFTIAFLTVFGMLASLVPASEAIIRIMPLGDSITRGFTGSSDQTGYRRELDFILTGDLYSFDFVGSLFEPIGLAGVFDIDHEGHSGFTTNQIASNVYTYLDTQRLAGNPADIVLLHIGTNDIDDPGFDLSADDVAAILNAIDDYEVDNDTTIQVILARIINRGCTNPPCPFSDDTTTFNNNVEAMAQDRIVLDGDKILIVDMENGAGIDYHLSTDTPPGDMWNDKHPFDTGFEKMADLWFSAIQQVTLPVANAGLDQTNVKETTVVTLDGSGSSDPDGTIPDYLWEEVTTTGVTITNDPTTPTATFTAPDVAPAGTTLIFRLTVTDDDGFESSDTVSVDIIDRINPVADAGPNQTNVKETTVATLNGSNSSDADGTIISYFWEQLTGTAVVIVDDTTATPTFSAPQVDINGETLTFRLTVTDDDGLQTIDTTSVGIIDRINPVADAGPDQTNVKETTVATLNGSNSSDADGIIASYQWLQTAGTVVQLSDVTSATPTFTAPQVDANGATLTFQLMVTDDDGLTSSDTTSVSVSDGTVASTDGGGGGGGGGCFIAVASGGVPLQSYVTGPENIHDQSMIPGNPIFMMILFALCLCAGIILKLVKLRLVNGGITPNPITFLDKIIGFH